MPAIFDLNKVKKLVDKISAQAVVLIDTNILMKNPDIFNWKTSLINPVFLMSDVVSREIVLLGEAKNKSQGANDTADKARKARDQLIKLFQLGNIDEGIQIPSVGWFISTKTPSAIKYQPEMAELSIIADTLKQSDTLLLLLTRDCREIFTNVPVIFVTSDTYLYMTGKHHVPSIFLSQQQFPSVEFERYFENAKLAALNVDWEGQLLEIQNSIEDSTVELELTLESKRFENRLPYFIERNPKPDLPNEGSITQALVAEGYGRILFKNDKEVLFKWRLPYKPWITKDLAQNSLRGEAPMDYYDPDGSEFTDSEMLIREYNIDFLGKDRVLSEELVSEIIKKLKICTSPASLKEGLPTLQNAYCCAAYYFYYNSMNYLFNQLSEEGRSTIEELDEEIPGRKERFFWELIFRQYKENEEDKSDKKPFDYLELKDSILEFLKTPEDIHSFVDAVTGCWSLGKTVKTRIPNT